MPERTNLLIGTIATVGFVLVILFQVPFIYGHPKAPHQYISGGITVWVIIPILVATLAGMVWYYSSGHWGGKLLLMALWVLFVVSLISASPLGFSKIAKVIYSPGSNSFFYVAKSVKDPIKLIAHYDEIVKSLPLHAHSHPPGAIIYHYAINSFASRYLSGLAAFIRDQGLDAPEFKDLSDGQLVGLYLSSILIIVIASLSILFAYLIMVRMGGEIQGWRAALIIWSLPALSLLSPEMDQVYATGALAALFLFVSIDSGRRALKDFATGAFVGFLTFFTFQLAILIPFLGFFEYARSKNGGASLKRVCSLIVGFLLFNGVLMLFAGYNPLQTALISKEFVFEDFGGANIRLPQGRDYLPFLLFNPVEVIFLSVLPFLGFIFRKPYSPIDLPFAVILGFIVALGITRGEFSRVHMYLLPLLALSAITHSPMVSKRQFLLLAGMNILIVVVSSYGIDLVNPAFSFRKIA